MTVVQLPKRPRPAPKLRPLKVIGDPVTMEERAASANLRRIAEAIDRTLGSTWATPEALARVPGLIAEAEAAIEQLKEMVGS